MLDEAEDLHTDTDDVDDDAPVGGETELEQETDVDDDAESSAAGTEAGATDDTTAKPKSAWDALQGAIRDLGEGKLVSDPPAKDGEGEDGKPKPGAAKDGADKKGDKDSAATPSRYTITDTAGDELEIEWPEGATIRFKADGREVKLTGLDEVVQLAQKGVAFDRVSSEAGQLRTTTRGLTETLDNRTAQFEDTLLKVLFDKEAFKAVRKEMAKYRDPAVREAARKAAKHDERTADDARSHTQQREQAVNDYWAGVGTAIDEAITGGKFQYLQAEDKEEVVRTFYSRFESAYETIAADLQREYPKASDDDIARVAESRAIKEYLGDDTNLRKAIKDVNAKYERRVGKNGGKPKDPAAEAEAHNQRTDKKLNQRRERRPIRGGGGGGAPAAGAGRQPARPTSWDGHMAAIRGEFTKLRK